MGDKQEKESKLPIHKYKLRTHNGGARERKKRERRCLKKGETRKKIVVMASRKSN